MNRNSLRTVSLALALTAAVPVLAGDHEDHSKHSHASKTDATHEVEGQAPAGDDAVVAEQLPTYPLNVCLASGEELGSMGEPVNHVHEGRLVRFCCSMCEKQFSEDPAAYLAKIDAAVIQEQLASYPLSACPVSGMKLGSMGEPYNHVHGTRLVQFCCGGCLDKFNADPVTYLAKIDAAADAVTTKAD